MSDPVEFLKARRDEDEAVARACAAQAPEGSGRWHAAYSRDNLDPAFWTVATAPLSDTPIAGPDLPPDLAKHIARWDPARILAEVEATRAALLTRGRGVCTCDGYDSPPTDRDTRQPIPHHYDCAAYEAAMFFVQVYADHPDFDPAWSPS